MSVTASSRIAFPAALLAVSIMLVLVAHVVTFGQADFIIKSLQNYLHAPGFGLFALGMLFLCRKAKLGNHPYLYAAASAILLGALSEFAQVFTARDADLLDWVWDIIGITGFLGIASLADRERSLARHAKQRWLLAGGAVLLFLLAVAPLAYYSYAYVARQLAHPSLLEFDRIWEHEIISASSTANLEWVAAPDDWPLEGMLGRFRLSAGEGSALVFQPHSDWQGYDRLTFIAGTADGSTLPVTLRVNDHFHTHVYDDRFNQKFILTPTPRQISISLETIRTSPATRVMDLSRIQDIILFASDPAVDGYIYVDAFRLESDTPTSTTH